MIVYIPMVGCRIRGVKLFGEQREDPRGRYVGRAHRGDSVQKSVSMGLVGVFGLGIVALAGEANAVPTTELTVTGDVVAPATYTLATLQLLPPTTETVTYKTAGGAQTGTFTGPILWTLLNTVGCRPLR